jgi:type II secretory pathway component GspD/PulD (secretin)
VTIPDGGTMLVGGLSTVRERSGEAGVPLMHDIPLLKFLFREWTQFDSRNSLLVLVTAEIVPDIFEE